MTTSVNLFNIKKEIEQVLRNANVLTLAQRNATTATENFTATAGQTVFTLTNTIRNIRSMTVNSVSKYLFQDYEFDGVAKTVTLYSGATLGHAVVIQYDHGSGGEDKIYPDYPRGQLTLSQFPRIALEETSVDTQPLGLGAINWMSDIVITIYVMVPTEKTNSVGGTEYLNDTVTLVRQTIMNNSQGFKLFKFIKPGHVSPIIKGENDKVMQQSQDFTIQFLVE